MVNRKLIEEYSVLKEALAGLKKEEADMRISILEELFTSANVGTFNAVVGDFAIKGVFKNNYRLNAKEYEAMVAANILSADELACVVLKPTLSLRDYNACDATNSLDECITVSPAMPTLTIKELDDE